MSESSAGVVRRYLEDVIAGERTFESQLEAFATRARDTERRELFRQSADLTKRHHEQLTNRLQTLAGGASLSKNFLSHLFSFNNPKPSQGEGANEEGSSQDLIAAFALAHRQLALCEVVVFTAEAASDPDTAVLSRSIQEEIKRVARSLWNALSGHFPLSYAG